MADSVPPRPDEICPNCFATWRATRPLPPLVQCWHRGHMARLTSRGWRCMPAKPITARRAEAALERRLAAQAIAQSAHSEEAE